jgi:hypothetical protein
MMSNEEFDRKMEFIINQQAQFDANIQQLQESHKATDRKIDRFVEVFSGISIKLAEGLTSLTHLTQEGFKQVFESQKNTDVKLAALVDSQIQTEEKLRETDEIIRNIGKKIDRHLTEGHDGQKS